MVADTYCLVSSNIRSINNILRVRYFYELISLHNSQNQFLKDVPSVKFLGFVTFRLFRKIEKGDC